MSRDMRQLMIWDFGGLYITAPDNVLDLGFKYKEQYLDDKNDICIQEIGKFAHLLLKSNPTVLESLFVDDEFVIYEHPVITELKRNRDRFLSKECFKPFYGYATSQIEKATGQKKMVTQPIIERKTPLDFCFTFHKQGSTPIKKWLEYRGLKSSYVGLNNIPNCDMVHGLFYSFGNHFRYENISKEEFLSWCSKALAITKMGIYYLNSKLTFQRMISCCLSFSHPILRIQFLKRKAKNM